MNKINILRSLSKQSYCFVLLTGMLLACIFLPSTIYAQSLGGGGMTVSRTSITATNEELIDLVLKITNQSPLAISGRVLVNVPANFEIVSKAETTVEIQPGDSMFLPVKVFASKKVAAGRTHTLSFTLHNKVNLIIAQTSTQVRVSANRNVSMFTMVSNILLDNNMDSIVIPVRVTNRGNTSQRITVVSSYPSSVQDVAFHLSKQVLLPAAADTILYFSKAVSRKMVNSEGFNVTINGLYENGDQAGMGYVRVQSARSNRNFRGLSDYDQYNENSITASSQGLFSPAQSYMLRGNGSADIGGGKLGYNLDITSWKNSYTTTMIRNTWLGYEQSNMGIRAGNINRNFDIYLSGRGAAAYINDTAHGNHYEAGYIDGNTNLIGSNFELYPTGQAGWGMFSHIQRKWRLNSYALYESNPALNANNAIIGNSLNFSTSKNLFYNFTLNGGYTSEYTNNSLRKFGMAAGATVMGTIGNFAINSTNYFSTGFYPGIQRGALTLSERITWMRTASSTVWASFDYNRFEPKMLSSAQYFLPAFGTLRAETGISGKIGKLNASGAPRYSIESSDAYQFSGSTGMATHDLTALDITGSFNYPIAENHYVSINVEAGLYYSSFAPEKRFHSRSTVYYRKGIFSLNAMAQTGTFYLGEAANNHAANISSGYMINIIPSVQKSFFRNKMRTELSIGYMENNYSGQSLYIAGRVDYAITDKTDIYTIINHNRFGGYASNIVELGITQKLQLPKAGVKKHTLELFVYKDINRNGSYDAADSAADGYMLYINDDIFISSSDGTVIYKKLPEDSYRLNMPANKGWYAPEKTITLTGKTRVEIPLQQAGTIKGNISLITGDFGYDINTSLSGIMITVTDSSNRRYTTKTGPDGNFIFYVPVGNYTISIEKGSLIAELEAIDNDQRAGIEAGTVKIIGFKLKVKSRKIETKKFVSPSVKQ
jgi:hypothetical protein